MSHLPLQIEELARPIVEAKNALFIDVNIRSEGNRKVVEVFVDADNGVSTELCSQISRELAELLERQNMLHGAYDLIVSSPGIERPLKYFRQYQRNIGRTMVIKYKQNDMVESIEGKLLSAEAEQVVIGLEREEQRKLLFPGIVSAKVKAPW